MNFAQGGCRLPFTYYNISAAAPTVGAGDMSGREREPYVEGRVKTARQSGYYEVVGYDKLEVRELTAVDNLDYGT